MKLKIKLKNEDKKTVISNVDSFFYEPDLKHFSYIYYVDNKANIKTVCIDDLENLFILDADK